MNHKNPIWGSFVPSGPLKTATFPFQNPRLPSQQYWDPSESPKTLQLNLRLNLNPHAPILRLYNILKRYFFLYRKMLVFNFCFFLLNVLIWSIFMLGIKKGWFRNQNWMGCTKMSNILTLGALKPKRQQHCGTPCN